MADQTQIDQIAALPRAALAEALALLDAMEWDDPHWHRCCPDCGEAHNPEELHHAECRLARLKRLFRSALYRLPRRVLTYK